MSDAARAAEKRRAALLQQIPSVDELLRTRPLAELCAEVHRGLVVETARRVLEHLRREIGRGAEPPVALDAAGLAAHVGEHVRRELAPSLRPVINATGVVLHTNLGRAPLGRSALQQLLETAGGYANLEYDLAVRARGRRDVHTARLLARLTGAESAIVVNNCAAAVFLTLHAFARGGEVVVSRGELIEIGDGFRIPEIMEQSGARLREVGTTNRTRLADYEAAITEQTRMLLRVHRSNFRIEGFTERPSLTELAQLARRHSIPLFEDLGSGNLTDLARYGVTEPLARRSFEAGVDLIAFSGDKLLGGPQAGILAGKRPLVEHIRKDPLFRMLRVDKLTIAVLENTLRSFLSGRLEEIPALRMIRMGAEEIEARATKLAAALESVLPAGAATFEIVRGESVIGGGSTPEQSLPTALLAVRSAAHSAEELQARLHAPPEGLPLVARVEGGRLLLDLRTVYPEQEAQLRETLAWAICGGAPRSTAG